MTVYEKYLPAAIGKVSLNQQKTVLVNLNPLSTNPTKWSHTLKQFVGKTRRIF